jgi:phosphoglycolate phosphatase
MIDIKINGKILSNIELIIFDKDGTLFQLYPYCSRMVMERTDAICSILSIQDKDMRGWLIAKMGIDERNHRIFHDGPIGVYSKYYAQDMIYKELNDYGYEVDRETVQRAFAVADDRINDRTYLTETLVPVDGMIDFIKQINGRCKCAIFSNDMTERLKTSLSLFSIQDYFDFILGGDMITLRKPDPAGAIEIMNKLGVLPENTALIGDSLLDIESGERAKCKYLITMISDITKLQSSTENCVSNFRELTII